MAGRRFDWITRGLVAQLVFVGATLAGGAARAQVRIATYNTNNYSQGQTLPRTGVATVLEALGDQAMAGFARPLDILLVQEQSTLATTTAGFVDILNGIYGAGTYARGTLEGSTTGGGRPAVIYNTTTMQFRDRPALGWVRSRSSTALALRSTSMCICMPA
jgi:hypothetical protein